MIFKNKKLKSYFTVTSYDELISLCKKLREKDEKKMFTILIDNEDVEVGNYKFPYSSFHVINKNHRLVSKLYAKKLDENNNELTTWKTAALKITGDNNIFENLLVDNVVGEPEINGQEVAIGVYGDNNIFLNCSFKSTQDTLFCGPLPDDLVTRYTDFLPDDERYREGNCLNFFSNCKIYGTIDFIFGAGQVIFDKCHLITVYDKRIKSYVTAPSHSLKDDFGFFFNECVFQKEEEVEDNSTYLARPWREYGKAVFYNCNYFSHIKEEGFSDWNEDNRTSTCRFFDYPYSEKRVNWMKNKKEDKVDDKYLSSLSSFHKILKHLL